MEDTAQNNIDNSDIPQTEIDNKPVSTQPPTRTDILLKLNRRAEWLANKIDNSHTKLTAELKTRVYFVTVECQIYKTILYGMKELELVQLEKDIEDIKQALKEKHTDAT